MYRVTASISSGAQLKSGNPCDRLIAPCSRASRDIVVKIVTPVSGSFERIGRVRVRPLFYELPRLQGEDRVRIAQFDNAIVVGVLREFAAQEAIPQATDFVPIEIVHEL